MKKVDLKTENVRWDLSCLYGGVDDPRIEKDFELFEKMSKDFYGKYEAKLSIKLGDAIRDYIEIDVLVYKIYAYLYLTKTLNLEDEAVKSKLHIVTNSINEIYANYLNFFDFEITDLEENNIMRLSEEDEIVQEHLAWLNKIRINKPHRLSEEVESALVKRSAYSSGSPWSSFYSEFLNDIQFSFNKEKVGLEKILDVLSNDGNAKVRARALRVINKTLGERFAKFSAQTLNMVVGSKRLEDKERGYPSPMSSRNKSNMISDDVVEALHTAVIKEAAPLVKKYYQLKAELLNKKKLKWSDRNAPMSFVDEEIIPFDKAIEIVLNAYTDFSPTLGRLVKKMIDEKMIDAPITKNKRSGAFNYSVIFPENKIASYVFLNYLGSRGDVMTLAHELGHGVHGFLAAEAQGPLKCDAPIAYCETASIFGEMIIFDSLRREIMLEAQSKESMQKLLALYVNKIDGMMNTCVRQIGFSNFERKVHGEGRRLSVEELNNIWLDTIKELYGEDGDVFTYKNVEYLWSYIPHFHTSFYVYGYASGELFTQSIYAQRARLGDRFEPLYLDILRAGGTKDAVELLKPMGLNPAKPQFWANGIKNSFGKMIDEAERLAKAIQYC